jgi:hypothetical protein
MPNGEIRAIVAGIPIEFLTMKIPNMNKHAMLKYRIGSE